MELPKNCNIIFITLDGFRKDKLELCPYLQSKSKQSVLFDNMITVAPYTLASHHSMFTGMYPSMTGVDAYYNMFKFKKNKLNTLSELLQKSGYFTCSDAISEIVVPTKGFSEVNIFDEKTVDFIERHTNLIKNLASKKQKFFLFLHYTEQHKKYVVDIVQRYKDKDDGDSDYYNSIKENDMKYSSYMVDLDKYVAAIYDIVKNSGIQNNTILIFQADHGTSVGDKKGEKFYGVYVYDYTINVFSMIDFPNNFSKHISSQCMTIDLFPTIAEIGNVSLNELNYEIQGKSLFPLIENDENQEHEAYSVTGGLYGPWPSPEKHNVFCIRYKNRKLIYNDTPSTWEFYDLKNDPKEMNNIYEDNNENIKFLKAKLLKHFFKYKIKTKLTSNI
jgi:arylsulfatase A-like enzyme